MRQRTVILSLAFVCAIVLAGCGNGEEPDKTTGGDGDTSPAKAKSLIEVARGKGRVDEGSWFIDASIDLVVGEVLVKPGQRVKEGDLVFTGNYDEGGSTARSIAECEKKYQEAQAAYAKKVQEADKEIERLAMKIEEQEEELKELGRKLAELKVPNDEARDDMDIAKKAYDDYSDSMTPPDKDGNLNPDEVTIQKKKWSDCDSARALYEIANEKYNAVEYEINIKEYSIDSLKDQQKIVKAKVTKEEYGTAEETKKRRRLEAELAEIMERVQQTEFRAPADGEIVVVDVANGVRLPSRNRVALLIDTAQFVIKAQMTAVHDELLVKGAEFEMQLELELESGKETVTCRAVLLDKPLFDEDNPESATVLLKLVDCDTRARAEELMTKAANKLEWMRITLKTKQ